ncbi:MAG: lipoate--protein ligase family protein [Deltaproteobacteria bacterium]|nr:lipoate--protein ligase family protein [Deltaproteobacteria bacterium]
MASVWRLLQHGPGTGPWNMGVDEALLRSAARSGVATLRLYTWRGPWLSLGYSQAALASERIRALEKAGVGLVQRSTGGRAVLHGADLTYAVAAPEDDLAAGLRGSYDQVARALLLALRSLGVDAQRVDARAPAPGRSVFDCFARAAGDEICVAGRKLAGSAQRRVGGALLQHGSLRLEPDEAAVAASAGLGRNGATSLREVGCGVSEEALRAACVEAFAQVLDAELAPDQLTRDELECAERRPARGPRAFDEASKGARRQARQGQNPTGNPQG